MINCLRATKTEIINGVVQQGVYPINKVQIKVLSSIYELYSKDYNLADEVKECFTHLLNSCISMVKVINWWVGLSTNFVPTSIGKVIAYTNAKHIDNNLPDLD